MQVLKSVEQNKDNIVKKAFVFIMLISLIETICNLYFDTVTKRLKIIKSKGTYEKIF